TSDVVYAVSWSSVSVAPNSSAAAVWNFVQYGHLTAPAAANAIRCLYFSGMFVSLSSNFLNSSQPPLKASSSHLKSSKKPGTNPNVPLMSSSVFSPFGSSVMPIEPDILPSYRAASRLGFAYSLYVKVSGNSIPIIEKMTSYKTHNLYLQQSV